MFYSFFIIPISWNTLLDLHLLCGLQVDDLWSKVLKFSQLDEGRKTHKDRDNERRRNWDEGWNFTCSNHPGFVRHLCVLPLFLPFPPPWFLMQVAPSVWGWQGSGQPYWAELRGPGVLVVQRQGPHSCRPVLHHGSPASWLSSLPYKQRGNGLLTPPLSSVSLHQQVINRQHGNIANNKLNDIFAYFYPKSLNPYMIIYLNTVLTTNIQTDSLGQEQWIFLNESELMLLRTEMI